MEVCGGERGWKRLAARAVLFACSPYANLARVECEVSLL